MKTITEFLLVDQQMTDFIVAKSFSQK